MKKNASLDYSVNNDRSDFKKGAEKYTYLPIDDLRNVFVYSA